jgi:chemotaxis signal transduction protein
MALAPIPVTSAWWVVRAGSSRRRVPADQVVEVIAWPRITPVPRAPDVLLGITRYGDRIVPVVDVFGTSAADAAARSVAIVRTTITGQQVDVGIVVEEVTPGDELSSEPLALEMVLAPLLAHGSNALRNGS